MATLRELCTMDGPFATVVLPATGGAPDAAHRREIHWKNVRRELDVAGLDGARIDALEAFAAELPSDPSVATALVQPAGGPVFVEHLLGPDVAERVHVDALPWLSPIIESRQRAIPYVIVAIDRTGADIMAVGAGEEVLNVEVDGDTTHLTRSHPGGWLQPRFQQRAENQWEHNAAEVAGELSRIADRVAARVVTVYGDVRAVQFLVDHLPEALRARTEVLDVGEPAAVADATARLCADVVARDTLDLVERLREGRATHTAASGPEPTMAALAEGRVETLLIHDDVDDTRRAWFDPGGPACGRAAGVETDRPVARLVDAAIRGALLTDAGVRVVPAGLAPDGVDAILRW